MREGAASRIIFVWLLMLSSPVWTAKPHTFFPEFQGSGNLYIRERLVDEFQV